MSLRDFTELAPVVEIIHNSIINGRLPHAFILEGDAIVDKEQFALDFAKAILCKEDPGYGCDHCTTCHKIQNGNYEDMYIVKPEAAGKEIKRDDVETLRGELNTRPTSVEGRNIAIIQHGESMNINSQNRLLKLLEEPTEGTVIIILSENTEYLLPTIRSRCLIYRFNTLAGDEDNPYMREAKYLIKMAVDGEYFYKIKNYLDKKVKNEQDAKAFLDGMERVMRDFMVNTDSAIISRQRALKCVNYIEEAKKDLRYKVNYKYALRNLMLKIGG